MIPARVAYNLRSTQAKGLVAWWPPQASRGTTLLRDVVNGRNGVFNGNASLAADGLMGRVLSFDGTSDYIRVTRTQRLGETIQGNYTLTMWMKSSSATTVKRLWGSYDSVTGFNTAIFNYSSAGQLRFYSGSAADADSLLANASGLNDGTWRLYAFQVQGTTMRIFINGLQDNSRTRVGGTTSNADFFLGTSLSTSTAAQMFEGQIGDTRLYNRALSQSELWQMWNPATRWELYQGLKPRTGLPFASVRRVFIVSG
jgi:hypothetical protein